MKLPRSDFKFAIAILVTTHAIACGLILLSIAYCPAFAHQKFLKETAAQRDLRLQNKASALRAIAKYTAQLKQEPDSATLYALRAVPYRNLGLSRRALKDVAKSLAIDPRDGDVQAWQALLFGDVKQQHNALVAWRKAAALAPDNPRIQSGLGMAELAVGSKEAATTALKRAVAISPTYNDCYQLGQLAEKTGDLAARDVYMKMATEAPSNGTIGPVKDGLVPAGTPVLSDKKD